MHQFIDSSALVKRYIIESGTEELNKYCKRATNVTLSVISSIEISSAFARRLREKLISRSQYRHLKYEFSEDLKASNIVELYPKVISLSVKCLERAPLRSLDAIQIASALIADVEMFITSDERQCFAAKKMKLKTILIR